MKIEELNPFIRYATLHQTYYPQKENSICYDCRLFYVLQGDGNFFVNGQNYTVFNGFCAFLPPKTQYRFKFSNANAVKIYVLNFDLTDEFSRLSKSLGTASESTFSPSKTPEYLLPEEFQESIVRSNAISVQNGVAQCVELFLQKIAYYKHSASAHLKLVLFELLRESYGEKSDYKLVESVQKFIRNNYQNAELNNQEIAEQFNYHPYHINRLMKAHTQKTLHDYLIDYRLHMAKNFLQTTMLNVTQIAEKTGFSSYTYFIKLFRERTGLSPLQYRKTHKNIGF
jgi:AraC-like DNA-binding protein